MGAGIVAEPAAIHEVLLASPAATLRLGRRLGAALRGGDFVALSGPLGAGKTHLLKGVAAGLGVSDDETVVSPTFVLIREYAGRLRLYHIDAYRLESTEELLALGLEELASDPEGVIALEWADRTPGAVPPHACRVELEYAGATHRRMRITWAAERLKTLGLVENRG